MPKIKNIAVPAALGFVLSFLVSLIFGTHKFGVSLFRGLLFCLIFGILAFIIDFVYGKFLDDGSAVDTLQDSSSGRSESSNKVGARVDITIDDADLSNDGKELSFAVNRNRFKLADADTQDLRENDVMYVAESSEKKDTGVASAPVTSNNSSVSSAPVSNSQPSASSFKPVPLGQPVSAAVNQSAETKTPEPNTKPTSQNTDSHPVSKKEGSSNSEINALPDLDNFDNTDNSDDSSADGDADSDSTKSTDFSTDEVSASNSSGDSVSVPVPGADGKQTVQQDTETLAKAIRTVLKRDEQ